MLYVVTCFKPYATDKRHSFLVDNCNGLSNNNLNLRALLGIIVR